MIANECMGVGSVTHQHEYAAGRFIHFRIFRGGAGSVVEP